LVYLHEHKIGTATPSAMDKAAAAGFLDIVQFLHENFLLHLHFVKNRQKCSRKFWSE